MSFLTTQPDMLAAAAAWDGLAAELRDTAASYGSVISGLTGDSSSDPGPEAMAIAAAPYVTWMQIAAAQAEQSANRARAAAAAYEAAFAMPVPAPVMAVDDRLLMVLTATNVLGDNAPDIAVIQADWAGMSAGDAAAMYGPAGNSAAASTLTPFTSPPESTNPDGFPARATGANTEAVLSQLMSATPQTLQELASPPSCVSSTSSTAGMSELTAAPPAPGPGSAQLPRYPSRIGSTMPLPLTNIAKALPTGAAPQAIPAMVEALLEWLGSARPSASPAGGT